MFDDPGSDGDDAPASDGPNVRRRRLLAGAGALAFGAAVPGVGAAAADGSDPPRVAWQRRYGGDGPDSADALVRTSRGGYALAGHNPTDPDAPGRGGLWVADLDADGDLIWERAFEGLGGYRTALAEGPDGELVVAGSDATEWTGAAVFVALAPDGEELWRTSVLPPEEYRNFADFYPGQMIRASDGGYVVAGTLSHNEGGTAWVVKVSADGDGTWSTPIEVPLDGWYFPVSYANGIAPVDGGYAVGGAAAVRLIYDEFDQRPWAAKVTADGEVAWDRTYFEEYGIGRGAVPRAAGDDEGFVLAGVTTEGPIVGAQEDTPFLLWADPTGDVERVRSYPETPLSADGLVSSPEGYAFAGDVYDRGWSGWGVAAVDRCGDLRWSMTREDEPVDVRALVGSGAGYAVAGTTTERDESDGWVAELTADAE